VPTRMSMKLKEVLEAPVCILSIRHCIQITLT
jgi:hypothetical protein